MSDQRLRRDGGGEGDGESATPKRSGESGASDSASSGLSAIGGVSIVGAHDGLLDDDPFDL